MPLPRWIPRACLASGAVLFNGWILGGLGQGLAGYIHLSISELEVSSQPWHGLFRSLDGLSAILMILGSVGLVLPHKDASATVVAVLIAAVGILTLFDITHPLDCSSYQNPACVSHKVSHTNDLHQSESRITAYVSIVMAFSVALWAIRSKRPRPVIALAAFFFVLIIIVLAIENGTKSAVAGALAERAWNVLITGELLLLGAAGTERGLAASNWTGPTGITGRKP